MSNFCKNTSKIVTKNPPKPQKSSIFLISDDAAVQAIVRKAASKLDKTLSCENSFPSATSVAASKHYVYIVDPLTVDDSALGAAHILDNRKLCVLLFGGPAGLLRTRPAVCKVLEPETQLDELIAALEGIFKTQNGFKSSPKLSARERETLRFYGRGLTLKAIGHNLGISPKSAETYKTRACKKLGLRGRDAVLAFTEPTLRRL
jgi:DNA-binding CsgD family transcriptional regulator